MKQLVLLNIEGCILRAIKRDDQLYELYGEVKFCIGVLSCEEIHEFIEGKTAILDGSGKTWNYSEYPQSMKPSLERIVSFMDPQ
jgi:hypothetical protein